MHIAADTYQFAVNNGIATAASLASVGNTDTTLRSWKTLTTADGIYYSKTYNIVVITKDGVSLSGINFGGTSVQVQADYVTISDCAFDASSNKACINGFSGYSDLTVDHCSFDGLKLNSTFTDFIAAKGSNTVIANSTFINAPADAIYIENGHVTGNYIAGSGYMTAAHADGIWVGKTTGPVTIDHNIIDWRTPPDALAATNNPIRIIGEHGNVSDVTVTHNLVLGGSYSVFVADVSGGETTVSDITVSDNVIDKSMYGALYPNGQPTSLVYTDNFGVNGPGLHFNSSSISAPLDFTGMNTITSVTATSSINGTAVADHVIGGAGNNWISTGTGNDIIEGGGGRDYLHGGTGNDIFVYRSFGDSMKTSPDQIYDFTSGSDELDLSQIHGGPASVDAWTWLGSAAFSGTDWQIREFTSGGNTIVQVDKDGDMKADLEIDLTGLVNLQQSDFILSRVSSHTGTDDPAGVTLTGTSHGDTLRGGSGADVIDGASGKDFLYGGAGADTFVYDALSDSTTNTNGRDWIGDFKEGQDKIDLSGLAESSGLQSLSFIGTDAFSGVAGQVQIATRGSDTFVGVDTNGDRTPDLQIDIDGIHTLHASDFIL